MNTVNSDWTLIDWDGNLSLGYKCWRKSFGRGHVSVGVGDFLLVCFSYGNNSHRSYSTTRWDYDRPPITEEEAMRQIDANRGRSMNKRQPPEGWGDIKKY
jgi:hypothetical protein